MGSEIVTLVRFAATMKIAKVITITENKRLNLKTCIPNYHSLKIKHNGQLFKIRTSSY